MTTRRTLRRTLIATAAAVLTLLLAFLTVLYTSVGVPSSRYDVDSLPAPCDIIHEPTVEEIVGENPIYLPDIFGQPRARGSFIPDTAVTTCSGKIPRRYPVFASTLFFSTAQFHLGRTGEEQAEHLFSFQREFLREKLYPRGCVYELTEDEANVCGMYNDTRIAVYVQSGNVYMDIVISEIGIDLTTQDADPEGVLVELMETLAAHALAQLVDSD